MEQREQEKKKTSWEETICALKVCTREKKSQSDKSIVCTFIIRKATVLKRATFGLGATWFTTTHAGTAWSWMALSQNPKTGPPLTVWAFNSAFCYDHDPLRVRVREHLSQTRWGSSEYNFNSDWIVNIHRPQCGGLKVESLGPSEPPIWTLVLHISHRQSYFRVKGCVRQE